MYRYADVNGLMFSVWSIYHHGAPQSQHDDLHVILFIPLLCTERESETHRSSADVCSPCGVLPVVIMRPTITTAVVSSAFYDFTDAAGFHFLPFINIKSKIIITPLLTPTHACLVRKVVLHKFLNVLYTNDRMKRLAFLFTLLECVYSFPILAFLYPHFTKLAYVWTYFTLAFEYDSHH